MSTILRKRFPDHSPQIAEWRDKNAPLNEACTDYEQLHNELSKAGDAEAGISAELRKDMEASLTGLKHEIIRRLARAEGHEPDQLNRLHQKRKPRNI